MSKPPDRIYVHGGLRPINMLRAIRAWIEKHAAKEGKTLDPAWYRDSPEERPQLYPELQQPQTPQEGDQR